LVSQERVQFLQSGIDKQQFLLVYDIPLLMKHPNKYDVDYSIVVSASFETQKQRVLGRKGMTLDKFHQILSKQVPDEIQRKQADYVLTTDFPGYDEAKSQLSKILNEIITMNQQRWQQWIHLPIVRRPRAREIGEESDQNKGKVSREDCRLKELFDAVIFDFDDTLAPAMGPILDAHRAQMRYLSTVLNEENFQFLKINLTREIRRSPPSLLLSHFRL
jgi:hypothetical protein